ncbi:MAG: rhodanese-like domain-containing protein [Chloroflexota bacterium]|nr:MAG: MBL fold metallo-hydrolase [Chloroflexota bacterium]
MLLKYFYDPALSQASYLVGCQSCGEALIVDPARDITPYLEAARAENLQIRHIVETHIHADYVSGARELAAHTGAQLYLSAMGGDEWQYAFADANTRLLRDGDTFQFGAVRLSAIHTPGHTPEHLVFALTDTKMADQPMGLFTGDFLFAGDIGRPDLLETAAGIAGTKEIGARQQFQNVQRFKQLPDYLQIWPGHGAGSACGKALGSVPSTTLGYEKLFNPAFQIENEDEFVEWLLSDQPETPRYFGQMKRVNRAGPPLLRELETPRPLEGFILNEAVKNGLLVIDARSAEEYRSAHVPGTINIPPTGKFSSYAGEFIDYSKPTYLIAASENVDELVRQLRAIGVDNLPGYFPPRELGKALEVLATMPPETVAKRADEVFLLDVRGATEYREGHLPNAYHIPLGQVAERLDELPRSRTIVAYCSSGVRSQIVASLLKSRGFAEVANMDGGFDAWKAAGLPVETATEIGEKPTL